MERDLRRDIRPYDRSRDLDAVTRMWREIAWVTEDHEEEPLAMFLDATDVAVGTLDDQAECAVATLPGAIRYQETDLPLSLVMAVTTSHIGRKHGFATTMTADALRTAATSGAAVATLGMFEQGFYDRLGFGSGGYLHEVVLDPSTLAVGHVPYRQPARLGHDDYRDFYELHHRRHRSHGGVTIDRAEAMHAELRWPEKQPFGLGYRNGDGRLTHAIFGTANGERGPYHVRHIAYEEPAQLLELLRLLRELGDQVYSVKLIEPPEVQLQDLIDAPLSRSRKTASSTHATGIRSAAFTQLRILDLETTIAARHWPGPAVACNLRLTDPLSGDAIKPGPSSPEWDGLTGDYVLHIGAPSTITGGHDASLPTLEASIGAFSRCWFGVRPASSLALTDDLDGPSPLVASLDEALALPPPLPGWEY